MYKRDLQREINWREERDTLKAKKAQAITNRHTTADKPLLQTKGKKRGMGYDY